MVRAGASDNAEHLLLPSRPGAGLSVHFRSLGKALRQVRVGAPVSWATSQPHLFASELMVLTGTADTPARRTSLFGVSVPVVPARTIALVVKRRTGCQPCLRVMLRIRPIGRARRESADSFPAILGSPLVRQQQGGHSTVGLGNDPQALITRNGVIRQNA